MGPLNAEAYDNYIRTGLGCTLSTIDSFGYPGSTTYYLGEQVFHNGQDAYPVFYENEEDDGPSYYVYTEGDKVWCKSPQESEWTLAYDFSLKPGEKTTVGYAMGRHSGFEVPLGEITCFEETEFVTDYGTFQALRVTGTYSSLLGDYSDEGYWIKGLGSNQGLLWNCMFDLIANIGFDKYTFNDHPLLTSNEMSSNVKLELGNYESMNCKGRMIEIEGMAEGEQAAVYTMDGKTVGMVASKNGKAIIQLPASGLYFVSTPNTTRKMLVH